MKHIIRLRLMIILLLICALMDSVAVLAQLKLTTTMPHIGRRAMEVMWKNSPGATETQVRRREEGGAWEAWVSMGNITRFTDIGLSESKKYYYQVRELVGGVWSDASNEKGNGFNRIWPVLKPGGTEESREILNGFGEGIQATNKPYFHEGVDMQGESNVDNEVVRAPAGGFVSIAGGNGSDIGVIILVSINGVSQGIEFNHLQSIHPDILQGESVEVGQELGTIYRNPAWGTLSSHTHFGYWSDWNNPGASVQNPFTFFTAPAHRDPQMSAPHLLDVNNDGKEVRFRKTPDSEDYYEEEKVHNGVDIVAEAVDEQSVDRPWTNPGLVGYFIERKEKGAWTKAVKTVAAPYVVFDSKYYYQSSNDNENEPVVGSIIDFREKVKSKNPTTPAGYKWPQWFSYTVTNTKGEKGEIADIDREQFWATDARNTVGEENGYTPNYDKARIIDEAKFPDAKYRVGIVLKDLINKPDPTFREFSIDNFRPYAKGVQIEGGALRYKATWNWNAGNNQLVLQEDKNDEKVCGTVKIRITMSEPMKDVTVAIPSLPFDETAANVVGGTEDKIWEIVVPEEVIKNAPEGPHKLEINGHDMADNALQGFTDKGSKSGDFMEKRKLDESWTPGEGPAKDNIHEFKVLKLEIEVSTTPASDCKKKDGTAHIILLGAEGTFEYSVDGSAFQASTTFNNLAPGTHTATVRKKETGCSFDKEFTIEGDKKDFELDVSGYGTLEICKDQEVSVTLVASASGGSGNFDYSWPGGYLTVYSSGRYTVVATDKETGCKKSMGGDVTVIRIDCSKDPNDMTGPEGYGPGKMIAKSQRHSSMVRFENDPDVATAPAQVVKINHPLDSNVNPFSLRLGDFGFAGMTFSVPADKTSYTTRLNVMDSLGVVVDVTAGIDVTKREAFWVFESKDPATGLPPANSRLGFLPVNDSTGKGEGFVTYTIKAADHTQTGDSIKAKASIVFDLNAPIETPVVFNTVDALPPVSRVKALPVTSNTPTIHVNWSGGDDPGGSGVRDYVLYASENGGVFKAVQISTADTAIDFVGNRGSTYRFFTLATDNTGNAEAMKNAGEATVAISDCKEEVCNGVDDDCDGIIDEGCGLQKYYMDADKDGYGREEGARLSEMPIPGWVLKGGDCADWDPAVNPGATETANGRDDNCNGQVDEGLPVLRYYMDVDGDGYGRDDNSKLSAIPLAGHVLVGGDCADWDAAVYPGAPELANGRDDNCNGQADEGLPMLRYYMDVDGDGYGRDEHSKLSAIPLAGHVLIGGDCADWDATVHPGAPEIANGRDDNCNGQVDEGLPMLRYYQDVDKDGYGRDAGSKLSAIPLAGYVLLGGDCHDYDPKIYPGAPEIINGKDDNCNGQVDELLITGTQRNSSTVTPESTTGGFNVVVAPIPSYYEFTVYLQQGESLEKVRIRVFDQMGRLVEAKDNLARGERIVLGSNYAKGYYTLEAVQGKNRRLIKLIKL